MTTKAARKTPGRKPTGKSTDLEKTLKELESIVAVLESGELPLDRSLKEFERGVRLSRECQAALSEAEQRVQVLMGGELQDLPVDGDEAGFAAEDDGTEDAD